MIGDSRSARGLRMFGIRSMVMIYRTTKQYDHIVPSRCPRHQPPFTRQRGCFAPTPGYQQPCFAHRTPDRGRRRTRICRKCQNAHHRRQGIFRRAITCSGRANQTTPGRMAWWCGSRRADQCRCLPALSRRRWQRPIACILNHLAQSGRSVSNSIFSPVRG